MNRACKDCEFSWHDHGVWVQCRRRAPVFSQDSERDDGWPVVSENDWCGEFQPEGQDAELKKE